MILLLFKSISKRQAMLKISFAFNITKTKTQNATTY